MKQVIVFAVALIMIATACQSPKKTDEAVAKVTVAVAVAPVTLTLKWETDTLLTTSESVLYDKERDMIYVSNIAGAPDAKDKNGSISKVSMDGKIIEAQWVKGLDAPKGLGLFNNKLYVTDIDRIVEIDVTNGKITKSYKVDGAKFLNDITVDAQGRVYASDMQANNIILLENGKVSKWLENVQQPNGLLAEQGSMMMVLWEAQTLNSIDWSSKQVTAKADSLPQPDGIEAVGDGAYLVSSWGGAIHYVAADGKVTTVLDTRNDKISSADIDYVQEKNLLLIPTFNSNTVRAYELSKK